MKYFKNIFSLAELKKEYRRLSKALHPDSGGNKNEMQILNREFAEMKKTIKNKVFAAVEDDDFEYSDEIVGWDGGSALKRIIEEIKYFLKSEYDDIRFDIEKCTENCIKVAIKSAIYTNPDLLTFRLNTYTQNFNIYDYRTQEWLYKIEIDCCA